MVFRGITRLCWLPSSSRDVGLRWDKPGRKAGREEKARGATLKDKAKSGNYRHNESFKVQISGLAL